MRDIEKAIADYDRLIDEVTKDKETGEAAFWLSDFRQIIDRNPDGNQFDLISDALRAGFIIGQRYQKRQQKKARK